MTRGHGRREDSNLETAWEEGESIELRRIRPSTSVLSIRVPTKLLEQLAERARAQGKSASQLAREILEASLALEGPITPKDLSLMFKRWVEEAADTCS